ncbi:MAG: hypothetical protein EOO81_11390 [Oxalobacteraceae bacterium]|nr:MAG: hypothetical protein EOO81_11390 [Oxalobacteraceae bacterium]
MNPSSTPPHLRQDRKYFTPALAGIVGAAQLSTACYIMHPDSSTDVLLSGAAGPDMLWALPLGALLGTALGWVFLWLRGRPDAWRERRNSWFYAMLGSVVVAPMAPAVLGLGRQTSAQLWQGFASLYCIVWLCLLGAAQLERRGIL